MSSKGSDTTENKFEQSGSDSDSAERRFMEMSVLKEYIGGGRYSNSEFLQKGDAARVARRADRAGTPGLEQTVSRISKRFGKSSRNQPGLASGMQASLRQYIKDDDAERERIVRAQQRSVSHKYVQCFKTCKRFCTCQCCTTGGRICGRYMHCCEQCIDRWKCDCWMLRGCIRCLCSVCWIVRFCGCFDRACCCGVNLCTGVIRTSLGVLIGVLLLKGTVHVALSLTNAFINSH
jgi:hypothetical protein